MPKEQLLTAVLVTLALIIIGSTHLCAADKNETIYILCLLPYPRSDPKYDPSWSDGPPVSLALNMARDHINSRTDILPDYKIELLHADSGCDFTTRAFVSFTRNVYSSGNKIIGIIGPGCSSSSLALAPVSGHDEVSIITVHGGGSPLLSHRTNFPYSVGTLGSSEGFVNVSLELMKKSNWRKIGVLFDESRIFYSSTKDKLVQRIGEVPGGEVKFESPVYDSLIPLSVIRAERLRIVFLFTPAVTTRKILCLAFHLGFVYPVYQYIVTSNTYYDLATAVNFTYANQQYYCSEDDMVNTTLEGVTFLNYRLSPINETAATTYSNISFQEYDRLYREEIETYNFVSTNAYVNVSYSVWATYFYDALWAWAVVCNRLTNTHADLKLNDYEYGNTTLSNLLLDEFYALDFDGVSGKIKFYRETGFLNRAFDVFQVVDATLQVVAYYSQEAFLKIGPLQHIPDEFEMIVNSIPVAVVAIFLVIELLQGAVVIVLHIFSIKYRKYHSVKASSPKLNQLIFIGAYIFVVAMFLGSLEFLSEINGTLAANLCNTLWPWLFPVAFTLTFGTVAARTWRLYRIFTHYLNPGRLISNPILVGLVMALLVVDVIIGIVWVSVDPLILREEIYDHNATVQIINLSCLSGNYYIWFGVVISYKGVLLIAVLVLAVLTRNIQNQSFTTKTLRVLVYLFTIVFVVGFLCYYLFLFFMPLSPLDFVVLYTTLNAMLFLFNALVFFPPLLPLVRKKLYKQFPFLNKNLTNVALTEEETGEGGSKFYI